MRLPTTILILCAGLAISAAVWFATDGRAGLLLFPLVFGLPFLWRRKR